MSHVYLIIHLRWMLFRNSLRSKRNWFEAGTAAFVALVFAAFDLMTSVGLGVLAYALYGKSYFGQLMTCLLAGISLMWLCVPVLTASLSDQMDAVRFRIYPLTIREVLAIDLLLGLIDPAGLMVIPLLGGLFVGCAARSPGTIPLMIAFLLVFYIFNLALSRYIQRLIGAFFASRRRKEVLALFIFILLFMPQILISLNSRRHESYQRGRPAQPYQPYEQEVERLKRVGKLADYLTWTPPGITGRTIGEGDQQPVGATLILFLAALAFASAAVALEYERVGREYSGRESFWQRRARTRVLAPGPKQAVPARHRETRYPTDAHRPFGPPAATGAGPARATPISLAAPDAVTTLFGVPIPRDVLAIAVKDLRYLYRSPRALLMFIAPLGACIILALPRGDIGLSKLASSYQIPLLIFYALFANSSQMLNNSFSFDRDGAKLYFMSPVKGRDVLTGKNLAAVAVCLMQVAAILVLYVCLTGGLPLDGFINGLLVLGVALPFDLAIGNHLSIFFPRSVDFSKVYGKNYSSLSALMGFISAAVLAGVVAIAPIAGYASGSHAVQYAILAGECLVSIAFYLFFLKRTGKMLEERPEAFLQALLAVKQS